MTQKLAPAIYLGKLENFRSEQAKEYFKELKNAFKIFSDQYYLFIEINDDSTSNDCQIFYDNEFQEFSIVQTLEKILSKSKNNVTKGKNIPSIVISYIDQLQLPKNKVMSLKIPNQAFQKLMELGHELDSVREKNCALVGLGNITHNKNTSNEIRNAVKEFDSFVRIKLWEFDYYALRDLDKYFLFDRNLYLDQISHYGSFLVIFGSLIGTDILQDIYTGFEKNNSLRCFYYSTNMIVANRLNKPNFVG